MRTNLIVKLAASVADFMNDCYGRVTFDGAGLWRATDGGATMHVGGLTGDEAKAVDYAARHLAYPDA